MVWATPQTCINYQLAFMNRIKNLMKTSCWPGTTSRAIDLTHIALEKDGDLHPGLHDVTIERFGKLGCITQIHETSCFPLGICMSQNSIHHPSKIFQKPSRKIDPLFF